MLHLQVEDDGTGMPEQLRGGGMGMRTMAYRAQMIDAEFRIEPASGRGTRVICHVPRNGHSGSEHPSGKDEGRGTHGM